MSILDNDLDLEVTSFPKAEHPEDHFACCINNSITICGKEGDDKAVDEFPDEVDCEECNDKAWVNYCPLLGPDRCKNRWEEI